MESSNICERYLQGKYVKGKLQTFCLVLRITVATSVWDVGLSVCSIKSFTIIFIMIKTSKRAK
jgi:hypothetical protein